MQIPGIADLIEKGTIPESLLLLTGPAAAGKSIYCKQFFSDGLIDGDYCIYVSSSLTDRQFRKQFPNVEKLILIQNSKFINPYLYPLSPPLTFFLFPWYSRPILFTIIIIFYFFFFIIITIFIFCFSSRYRQ